MIIRSLLLAAIAIAGSLFIALPAAGQDARATNALNVRSGPGTNYRVVDVLSRGEAVRIERCSGSWCLIEHSGPDGWVSANYLTIYDGRNPGRNPGRDPDIGFCVEGPNFSFGVNCDEDGRRPGRPGFPGRVGEVCFYEHNNFRGASFCARPGQADRSLSRTWNDRISSIEVRGNGSAVVCQDFNFDGRCARVDRDIRSLGSRNDTISSYRVTR